MDEVLAILREIDQYAGALGDMDGDGPVAMPRRFFRQIRVALGRLQDYNADGVYWCMGCNEPIGSPGSWCPRCKRVRSPHADVAPWSVR